MKPNPICFPKQKFRFEEEGFWQRRKGLMKFQPNVDGACSSFACCSLSFFFSLYFVVCFLSIFLCSLLYLRESIFFYFRIFFFLLLVKGSLFIKKFEKLFPPFFFSTDRLMGNFHGTLSSFTCSCHHPVFSFLVCFVSRIFFSLVLGSSRDLFFFFLIQFLFLPWSPFHMVLKTGTVKELEK